MRLKLLVLFLLLAPSLVFAASPELIDAAKKEGNVVVYSITSRIANAAKSFEAKFGITVSAHNLKDFELIEKVTSEGKNNVYGADFIIAQDSGRVFGEIIKPGYAYSYLPPDMENVIPKNQAGRATRQEIFTDNKGLCQTIRTFLYSKRYFQTPLAAITQHHAIGVGILWPYDN